MGDALQRWFPGAFESGGGHLPDSPRFCHEIAGLAALADWIGSDRQFFEFKTPFAPDYDALAHDVAARALTATGFDSRALTATPAPSFAKLTDFPEPNPAQATVGSVDSQARLVILEAETGSGKTEAALWRFSRLLAAGVVSGLYFAVPTRAAARQLHGRVDKALRRVFGAAAPEAVLAIPGMLRAGEFTGQRLPHWRVRWDDDAATAPQRWAAEHATRFLAATVAVGTVDQAMLAGLQVKHAHLRGSALSRSLLVIDEVHASDAYMTEVLKHLLDGHLATGGYAMLMSATLGASARVRWTGGSLPDHEAACATPYPAVWVDGESDPRAPAQAGRPKTVHPEAVPTMDPQETAQRAISAAERGARVLVIRNTVTMAVATWRAVKEAGAVSRLMQVAGGPALHHGRFAAEDRALLDRDGRGGARTGKGTGTARLHRDRNADPGAVPRYRRRSADHRPLPDGRAAAAHRPTASARAGATRGIRGRARRGAVAGRAAWIDSRRLRSRTGLAGGRPKRWRDSTGSTAISRDWS